MIRVRIQHHPSRAHLLPALLESLGPLPVEVIEHFSDPPSPWAGYLKCMANLPRTKHVAILQDDVTVSLNFAAGITQIAAAQPDRPVCLFLGRLPRDASTKAIRAYKYGGRYVPISWRSFLPVVAVLWPTYKLREFASWAEEHPHLPGQRDPRSDDAMAGRWKLVTKQPVVACVPSIVEHPDTEPTTVGRTAQWGKSNPRMAALFARQADDYDWSKP